MKKPSAPNHQDESADKTKSHAKIIKPLTTRKRQKNSTSQRPSTRLSKKDTDTKNPKANKSKLTKKAAKSENKANRTKRATKLFDRKKNNNTKKQAKDPYTSVKQKPHTILGKATGASTRGSVETDRNRFRLVWGVSLVFLCILVARAFELQVNNAEYYQLKGEQLITSVRTQKAYRGMILDRNQLPLAISAPLSTVTFSPYDYALKYYNTKKELINSAENSKLHQRMQTQLENMDLVQLANVSGMSLDTLQKATQIDDSIDVTDPKSVENALPTGPGSRYMLLLNKVTPEIADAVMALDFAGVHEDQQFRRYYPQPQPSAQLLGFMGQNSDDPEVGYIGRAGIEKLYDSSLSGRNGKVLILNDARHNSLKEVEQLEPVVPGADLELTIDSRLQYILYNELEKVGRLQQARWASGMVVDVQTGEVLALSTWPSFNTNNLNEMTGDNQRNRPVQDVFEPGSVMKPFTVAAALDSGQYTTQSLIDTSPGVIRVKGYTIRDHGNLGKITLTTLLKKSSNVASTKIALALPSDGITSVQRRFGFGEKTMLNLPGEASGTIPSPRDSETTRRATLSYGYGLEVTLAQIAQAYATLGAGGIMHPLTIVKTKSMIPARRVIDTEQAHAIIGMLETVTQPGGTGTAAAIDGYRIAGKTGTSRRVDPNGGYYDDQYRTVFAGIAPASNPRLATVILVEDPRVKRYAGQVAAPVFSNVTKEALRLYNVPLDKPLNKATSGH